MIQSEDFIRIYENATPINLCRELIRLFDDLALRKKVYSRQAEGDPIYTRSDTNLFLDRSDLSAREAHGRDYGEELIMALDSHVFAYCEEFGLFNHDLAYANEAIKMQKIASGQGYHTWHWEHGPGPASSRVLVWMLYCNTISEGGETEFLFQRRRFKPKENTLLIWPAAFTHTHRGGLVLGPENKYICTGWIRYN